MDKDMHVYGLHTKHLGVTARVKAPNGATALRLFLAANCRGWIDPQQTVFEGPNCTGPICEHGILASEADEAALVVKIIQPVIWRHFDDAGQRIEYDSCWLTTPPLPRQPRALAGAADIERQIGERLTHRR